MRYSIERVCWCEKTYNGYVDSPYWLISLDNNLTIGLKDDGSYWVIGEQNLYSKSYLNSDDCFEDLKKIINECKLKIKLKKFS